MAPDLIRVDRCGREHLCVRLIRSAHWSQQLGVIKLLVRYATVHSSVIEIEFVRIDTYFAMHCKSNIHELVSEP